MSPAELPRGSRNFVPRGPETMRSRGKNARSLRIDSRSDLKPDAVELSSYKCWTGNYLYDVEEVAPLVTLLLCFVPAISLQRIRVPTYLLQFTLHVFFIFTVLPDLAYSLRVWSFYYKESLACSIISCHFPLFCYFFRGEKVKHITPALYIIAMRII